MSKKSFWDIISDYKIVVPLIQRDYVYGIDIEKINLTKGKLLKDIFNACRDKDSKLDLGFVYGSIVTEKNNTQRFEPLDGQQRLTTVWLLLNVLNCFIDGVSFNNDKVILDKFSYMVRATTDNYCSELKQGLFIKKSKVFDVLKKIFIGEINDYIKNIIDKKNIKCSIDKINALDINIEEKEFMGKLTEYDKLDKYSKVRKIKRYIFLQHVKSQEWYHSEYDSDINVESITGLIFDIMFELSNISILDDESELEKIYDNIKVGNNIFFQFMAINDISDLINNNATNNEVYIPNRDDVYIKINDRGLHLTSFENFKARIIEYIEKKNNNNDNSAYLKYLNNDEMFKNDATILANTSIYGWILDKISETIDLDFEDKVYKLCDEKDKDTSKLASKLDDKRINFIINIFLFLFINRGFKKGMTTKKYRELIRRIESIDEKDFAYEFTEYVNYINEYTNMSVEGEYFIEDAILLSILVFDKIKTSKHFKEFDIKLFTKIESKENTPILELEMYLIYIINNINGNNNFSDYNDFKEFTECMLSNINIGGLEEHISYYGELNKIINYTGKPFKDSLRSINETDAIEMFSFNAISIRPNFMSEYFKNRFEKLAEDYNKKKGTSVDAKKILKKFQGDFGKHFVFVFEFFGAISLNNNNSNYYYTIDVDSFIGSVIDVSTNDINKNNSPLYDFLKNWIEYDKNKLVLKIPNTNNAEREKLISNGWVLYKENPQSDYFYFDRNYAFDNRPLSFDYLMRAYPVDFDYPFNNRKVLFDTIKNNNVTNNHSSLTVKNKNYWQRIVLSYASIISKIATPSFKIKEFNVNNIIVYYYVFAVDGKQFNSICYDLYLYILKEKMITLFGNNVHGFEYSGFLGEGLWESKVDNCIKFKFNNKECIVYLNPSKMEIEYRFNGQIFKVNMFNNYDFDVNGIITSIQNDLNMP